MSRCNKDKDFLILIEKLEITDDILKKNAIPIKTTFFEKKKKFDRLMPYSFDGAFQLLHADVANLEFLGKLAVDPKYCFLLIDLFTSKIYTYPKKLRRFMNLNKKINVQMFSTNVRGGIDFAEEQKIRELKKIIFWLKGMNKSNQLRVGLKKIIRKSRNNMNRTLSEKYGIELEILEKNSCSSKSFRITFDFHRLNEVSKIANGLIRYSRKIVSRKKARLRENLELGEQVLV